MRVYIIESVVVVLILIVAALVFFFFYWYGDHRDLHSFPTRRSSDLEHAEPACHAGYSGAPQPVRRRFGPRSRRWRRGQTGRERSGSGRRETRLAPRSLQAPLI